MVPTSALNMQATASTIIGRLDVREVALVVEHLAGGPDADERAQRVEEAHQEKGQQDGQEAEPQHAGDVELEGDGRQVVLGPRNGRATTACGAWPRPSA